MLYVSKKEQLPEKDCFLFAFFLKLKSDFLPFYSGEPMFFKSLTSSESSATTSFKDAF
jgi:hypothetical protein